MKKNAYNEIFDNDDALRRAIEKLRDEIKNIEHRDRKERCARALYIAEAAVNSHDYFNREFDDWTRQYALNVAIEYADSVACRQFSIDGNYTEAYESALRRILSGD